MAGGRGRDPRRNYTELPEAAGLGPDMIDRPGRTILSTMACPLQTLPHLNIYALKRNDHCVAIILRHDML